MRNDFEVESEERAIALGQVPHIQWLRESADLLDERSEGLDRTLTTDMRAVMRSEAKRRREVANRLEKNKW